MIHRVGIVTRSLQVLIEITSFHICFFAESVTHCHVQTVLVKPTTIHMAAMCRIDEHFILHRCKQSFAESTRLFVQRYYQSVEIAKPCGKTAAGFFQRIAHGGYVRQPAFLQTESVLQRHRFAQRLVDDVLLPQAMLRNQSIYCTSPVTVGYVCIARRSHMVAPHLVVEPHPGQQCLHLGYMVSAAQLQLSMQRPLSFELDGIKTGQPAAVLHLLCLCALCCQ